MMNRWRRLSQAVFFGLFVLFFLYVCSPYPASPAAMSNGWTPQEVDPETETLLVVHDSPPEWIAAGRSAFLVDSATKKEWGRFRIVAQRKNETTLHPDPPLSDDAWDELSTNFGPWTIQEKSPTSPPKHYETARKSKAFIPAATFLYLDPLVGLSSLFFGSICYIALIGSGIVVFLSVLFPRCFCGFICPLGTLIDGTDILISSTKPLSPVGVTGMFGNFRYVFLAGIIGAGGVGVSLIGFTTPLPILSSCMSAVATPLTVAWFRGWYQVPPWEASQALAVLLLAAVLLLGLIGTRFWCRFLCPSGALLSLTAPFRLFEIGIDGDRCTSCGKCTKKCPFGAVDQTISMQYRDCTSCGICIDCCPANAIKISVRQKRSVSPTSNVPLLQRQRRRFLGDVGGLLVGLCGGIGLSFGIRRTASGTVPLRPPGSQAETEFLKLCVRCGECLQACPNNALQPIGIDTGLERLWTPQLVPDWSGCEPSCNNCGHVCPTGAIRALDMEQKRSFVIGVAEIDEQRCLPYATGEECKICVDECTQAGYHALEFVSVGTELDDQGLPVEGTGVVAPKLIEHRCIGCGLCQTRCRAVNVTKEKRLDRSAIIVKPF